MDVFGLIHAHVLGLLAGSVEAGALPRGLDLSRFSAVPPRGVAPGDIVVDAGLVYAGDAAPGFGAAALLHMLRDGLRAAPEVAEVAVAGSGILVVTLRPEALLGAVAALLRSPPAVAELPSGGLGAGSLAEARARASDAMLSSLAWAAHGQRPDAQGHRSDGLPATVGPVVLHNPPSGGADPHGVRNAGSVLAVIGADAFRFAAASRRRDAALHLDLAVLGERSRADPAFWVPYAHARARAVLRRAAAPSPGLRSADLAAADLSLLADPGEAALARLLARHRHVVAAAAEAGAPQRLAVHLREVADAFHGQWNRSKDQPQLRFVNEEQRQLTQARLGLIAASALVLRSGLAILGLSAPDEML